MEVDPDVIQVSSVRTVMLVFVLFTLPNAFIYENVGPKLYAYDCSSLAVDGMFAHGEPHRSVRFFFFVNRRPCIWEFCTSQ